MMADWKSIALLTAMALAGMNAQGNGALVGRVVPNAPSGGGLGTSRPTIAATTTGIAPSMTVSLFYGFRSFHCSFTIQIFVRYVANETGLKIVKFG